MAARTVSNRTTACNKILQSLGWYNFRQAAGAAPGIVANRPMTTDTDPAGSDDQKSINVDRRPDTSHAPARRGRRDELLPGIFSDPWDPFNPGRTLSQILNYMDKVMDSPFGGRGMLQTGWDAREDDKSLCLKVEMPGLSKDDVRVWVEAGNTLVIKGEKEEETDTDNARGDTTATEGNQQGQWRSSRRYSSRIEIPERGYKLDQIKAEMKHGVLQVVIPKAQEEDRDNVIEVQIDG